MPIVLLLLLLGGGVAAALAAKRKKKRAPAATSKADKISMAAVSRLKSKLATLKVTDMRPMVREMIATVVRGRDNAAHFINVSEQEDDVDLLWTELWAAFANNFFVDGEDVGYSTADRQKELAYILEVALAADWVHPERTRRLHDRFHTMRKHSRIKAPKWIDKWDKRYHAAKGTDQGLSAYLAERVNAHALSYKIPAAAEKWRDATFGDLLARAIETLSGASEAAE